MAFMRQCLKRIAKPFRHYQSLAMGNVHIPTEMVETKVKTL